MSIKFRPLYSLLSFFFVLVIVIGCSISQPKKINHREGLSKFDALDFPNKKISDGPYIFNNDDQVRVMWRENDQIKEEIITPKNMKFLKRNFGIEVDYESLLPQSGPVDYTQEFDGVKQFIVISDMHGQYKLFVKILREYQVIDEKNNWIYGDNHLVILGDVFDRGDQVNECFWLLFELEQQAQKAGGKLHFILGNHEEMVLNNDLRYLSEKYLKTAELLDTTYNKIFDKSNVLGQWLRTKPVILQINDILLVHGGISPEFVEKGFKAAEVNEIFVNTLIGKTRAEIKQDPILKFLKGKYGPIWYRGYFGNYDLDGPKVDSILNYFDKKHIIVGHNSRTSITTHFRNRIFGVDSKIKEGRYGEILIYDEGDFFRGTIKMSVSLEYMEDD